MSFQRAARELHKTPAAVSQQIKQLEHSLGFALFARYPRHVAITDKGRELAGTVSRMLGELRAKVGALQDGDDELVLRISATHSFAIKWLVPRLHRFTALHPRLDLRVDASDLRSACRRATARSAARSGWRRR
jgi:LysR family glycine cleavage system transcriptional activator